MFSTFRRFIDMSSRPTTRKDRNGRGKCVAEDQGCVIEIFLVAIAPRKAHRITSDVFDSGVTVF